ncbi:MAG: hypothetical protein HeimC3_01080 [Candidatus Heimdallarchaeota archaeon LC_3]|nr:MAG: hypothetical protein HeimC3_01080 [Candidatus Heimdallarchaeota archaeon LC_3]
MSQSFDHSFADQTYNKNKLDLASRIAQNREKHTQLLKELKEYKRIEKTGNKSFEDPQKRQEIFNIQETIDLESKLTYQLEEQVKGNQSSIQEYDKRINNLSNTIQKNKEEKQLGSFDSNLFLESRTIQLQDREKQLEKVTQSKKEKIIELKREIDRIKDEIDKKSKQASISDLIVSWKEGGSPDDTEIQKISFTLFKTSVDSYNDARQSMDAGILEAYYRQIRTSLLAAIDCVFILVMNTLENYKVIDYFEKIDELFAKKVVVNPIMIEKLDNLVQKYEDGVEIQPNQRFFQDVFEYLDKNLKNLKMI